ALLVVVPLFGLWLARSFERELLRSEEEGLVAVAAALAAAAGPALGRGEAPGPAERAAALEAARRLEAQVRLVDAGGRALVDSGPEEVEVITRRGRFDSLRRRAAVGEPAPPGGGYGERPEVRAALGGAPGRATRVSGRLRAVRLHVAEPARDAAGRVVGAALVERTTYPVLVSLYSVRNGLVRVALGSLLLAALVATFLAFTISRPLARLTAAARRIAAGERGVALGASGRDEIGELARAFDAMARGLDARLAYISEFAANVSHEFKTPMASIRGAAELLRDGAADDPAARARFLDNILDDTRRLERLVSRLLELSRLEARPRAPGPVDYRALVGRVADRYRAAGRRVDLAYEAEQTLVVAPADALESALVNLLDNARNFSPAGEPLRVEVVAAPGGGLLTRVVDRGRGISPANLPRVWDRFFTTARAEGGTGLGLAIVRAVVEAQGGRLGVESRPGEGSTFWFWLPQKER
ncbi:MAG TPA: HAMP domain-containing sensor histidine kinase, partial [Polyangiaceae bacterium]|nr:HAMP domain-containing sensor histidine kinase [Polyangiaceae bacterium]